jgi:two-component system CheB/CheR fusion protein
MAKKEKNAGNGGDRHKKMAGTQNEHPDQAAAEREEKKTLQQEEYTPEADKIPGAPKDQDTEREDDSGREDKNKRFPIIGIGASAGGLEALEAFLSHMPKESGMAVVIISHTDPERATMLPDILKRKSKIPVSLIEDGNRPEQNRAYLPPSDKDLMMKDGAFHLEARQRRDGLHMPIDLFLRSLAEDCGERAGCVILSGTGTDGTQGLRLIKEKAGVAVSQKPDSARHPGMPQSAIDTGLVDFILAPGEMPKKLIQYFEHPGRIKAEDKAAEPPSRELQKILTFLANRTHHDFSLYKKSTLVRRIERRMSVTGSQNGSEYISHLHRNPREVESLFEDLLIGVTNFFRDPEVFSFLRKEVLPDMIGRSPQGGPLRVWIAGCSTGEEAYSVAMIVREALEEAQSNRQMQVFATDLDRKAIEKARRGTYIENIAGDVNPERLERFFIREDHHYRLKSEIRESIVFAVQNLLSDPPFSSLDLLVCRNLLIYLEAKAQQKLLPLFHYTLKKDGVLFLGSSESVGRFVELFEPINKKFSIYRKKEVGNAARPMVEFPTSAPRLQQDSTHIHDEERTGHGEGVARETEKELLKRYTPACVVVDREGGILHVHGRTGKYLEDPAGRPTLNIVDKAREGIRFALSSALRKADSSGEECRHERLRVRTNGGFEQLNLTIRPFSGPSGLKNAFMVVFEDLAAAPERESRQDGEGAEDQNDRILELESELSRVRQEYQGSMEELQSSNEELRSANEEIQSSNEELQSANEELESSREELQSLNEELSTVNSELNSKTEDLSKAYESITNVLDSTQIAILFLTRNLTVKRFTSGAAGLFNLIESDIGRPIEHISHNLTDLNFGEKARRVLDDLTPFEDDIRTKDGHWYRMRIMVHRTGENVIEGTVATLVNIDVQKQAQAEIERRNAEFAESIVNTIRESLLVLDVNFRVDRANRSFYETFKLTPERVKGRSLFELGEGQWDIGKLRDLLTRIVSEGTGFENYRIEHPFKTLGLKRMLLNARILRHDGTETVKILLAIEDITNGKNKND